jgi:Protein of unknown function (DUF998)
MVGVVSGAASPVLLIAGWTVAAMMQLPSFSQVADPVSALAAAGATARWVMTLVFVVVGVCDVVTAAALRPAAPAGRLVLIAGAGSGMLVAAFPEHPGGGSVPHTLWASLGSPDWRHGLARRRGPSVPWAHAAGWLCRCGRRPVRLAGLVRRGADHRSGQVGLAERIVGAGQAVWPLAVVLSCRAAI